MQIFRYSISACFLVFVSLNFSTRASSKLELLRSTSERSTISFSNTSDSAVARPAIPLENEDEYTDQARTRLREIQSKERTRSNQLGISYGSSSACPTSVGLFFSFGNERLLSHTDWRTRIEALYMDIKANNISSSAFGLGVSETFRWYARRIRTSAFVQLNAGLFLTQASNTVSDDAGSLHVGPRLKESVGYSFNQKFQLELGLYQQWIWGSNILPQDNGFYAGISFHI